LEEEGFLINEWVKSAVEINSDKILACCAGDNSFYLIDRTLNLILRTIEAA
jgi:hypothetical protein